MRQLPNRQNEELFYPAMISNFSAKQQMTMHWGQATWQLNAVTTVSSRVGSYSSSKLGQTTVSSRVGSYSSSNWDRQQSAQEWEVTVAVTGTDK